MMAVATETQHDDLAALQDAWDTVVDPDDGFSRIDLIESWTGGTFVDADADRRWYEIEQWLANEPTVLWISLAEAGADGGTSYLISSKSHPAG